MKRSGHADLPLHGGNVPQWFARANGGSWRGDLGKHIIRYGACEPLARLADSFWFQAFGCVLAAG
jgi:hypothetical protein